MFSLLDLEATTERGISLMRGDGVAEGERLLRDAARQGDPVASIILKGTSSAQPGEDGFYLYSASLTTSNPQIQRRLISEAGVCFLRGHQRGDVMSSTNLAYLIRRGELGGVEFPPLSELLQKGLDAGHEFARINQALRMAAGVQCTVDWRSADDLVASLPGTQRVVEWWQTLCEDGDPEGHLVIGWLVRHGLTADSGGLS